MKPGLLMALVGILLAVSACVIEPYGGGRGDYYRGDHEYGHRVWRE